MTRKKPASDSVQGYNAYFWENFVAALYRVLDWPLNRYRVTEVERRWMRQISELVALISALFAGVLASDFLETSGWWIVAIALVASFVGFYLGRVLWMARRWLDDRREQPVVSRRWTSQDADVFREKMSAALRAQTDLSDSAIRRIVEASIPSLTE